MRGDRRVLIAIVVAVLVLGSFAYVYLGGPMPAFGPWRYVASKNSARYHDPPCVWIEQIRSKRYFSSPEAAEEAGCVPCPLCVEVNE